MDSVRAVSCEHGLGIRHSLERVPTALVRLVLTATLPTGHNLNRGKGRQLGQVAYAEDDVLDEHFVEGTADKTGHDEDDLFGHQFGLAVAIFAPVVAAYAAIGYGLYVVWGALS